MTVERDLSFVGNGDEALAVATGQTESCGGEDSSRRKHITRGTQAGGLDYTEWGLEVQNGNSGLWRPT